MIALPHDGSFCLSLLFLSQEVERELRNSDRTNDLLRRELGRLRQFVSHIMGTHTGASESEAKLAYLAWVQKVGFDALCRADLALIF